MTPAHDSRPRPQYGEYADPAPEAQVPETAQTPDPAQRPGSPETPSDTGQPFDSTAQSWARREEQDHPDTLPAPGQTNTPMPAGSPAEPVAPQLASTSGPLPGVPHNLGAKGSGLPGVSAAPQSTSSAHTAGQERQPQAVAPHRPTSNSTSSPADAVAPGASSAGTGRPRGVDRIITIVLLVVGAYFALSLALTLSQMTLEFGRVADQLGVEDFVASPSLSTLGTVGAILVLAIYAIVLIFSIRRLRARKLTFWAPLAAGALAWLLFFVLFFIGLNQSPELWQALVDIASDPAAAQELLKRLNSGS